MASPQEAAHAPREIARTWAPTQPIVRGRVLGRDVVSLTDACKLTDPLSMGRLDSRLGWRMKAVKAIAQHVAVHSCPHGDIVFLDEFSEKLPEIVQSLTAPIRHLPFSCLDGLVVRYVAIPYYMVMEYLGVEEEQAVMLLQRGLASLAWRDRVFSRSPCAGVQRVPRASASSVLVILPLTLFHELREQRHAPVQKAE